MGLSAASISKFREASARTTADVFGEHLANYGEAVTFGSDPAVKVQVLDGDYTRALVEGGMLDEGTVRIKFLRRAFGTLPAMHSAATFQGRPFRVHRVRVVPGAVFGEIDLTPLRR